MSVALITGSAGLIGSEAARFFGGLGLQVVGIDNDMRRAYFGDEASTAWNRARLERELPNYTHHSIDIRDYQQLGNLFGHYGKAISLVIHTAAQPSHDWAASDPFCDFDVNARGTLNLLEATRSNCPDAVFIFTSTNKVYGDLPNRLPLIEQESRWEIAPDHEFASGIPETMSLDQSTHSLYGCSKAAADLLVQEYGRYFGMRTVAFRGGCQTGPRHAGTQLHGFLAYLMKCAATGKPYRVIGYKGKQVRDNIHSSDLIAAFHEFFKDPDFGAVYNIGGGRQSNCSVLEAIRLSEDITGRKLHWDYVESPRIGDHIWYVSNLGKFKARYPGWSLKYDVPRILKEMHEQNVERWGLPLSA